MSLRSKETQVFFLAHVALLAIVAVGFARTFYLRGLFYPRPLSMTLQLHGAALTFWFALAALQGWLALTGRRAWHARLAWLAVVAVAGVLVTGLQVNTGVALQIESAGDPENMFVWANYMSLLSFVGLVALAVAQRRRLPAHRRLLLFASLSIIGPAFARVAFWPWVGQGVVMAPAFAGAGMLLLIALAVGYDVVAQRRVQAATWVGLAGLLLPIFAGTGVALSGAGFALLHHV